MANAWTDEQVTLALEFFYGCDENTQTDSHATCIKIAAEISAAGPARTASALDKTLRNIKAVDVGGVGLDNASDAVKRLVAKYKGSPAVLAKDAAAIRAKYKLPTFSC